jgi:hypothetical protein
MSLVFYSSFIPNKEKLFIGEDFLKIMLKNFKQSIICIGIQKNSINEWVELIETYKNHGLEIYYENINEELYVNSDVSGFQKALEIYCKKLNYKSFNGCVWFGHSKSVTSNNIGYHNFIMKYFWEKKEKLEFDLLSKNETGSYSFYLSVIPNYGQSKINDIWSNYTDFKFSKNSIGYMYTNTFFMCKKEPFLNVFKNIKEDFFNKKLMGVSGEEGDRYFFERDFIHFVDMQNLEPSFEELSPNNVWGRVDYKDFINEMNIWKMN